jgi:hypothetical protein
MADILSHFGILSEENVRIFKSLLRGVENVLSNNRKCIII